MGPDRLRVRKGRGRFTFVTVRGLVLDPISRTERDRVAFGLPVTMVVAVRPVGVRGGELPDRAEVESLVGTRRVTTRDDVCVVVPAGPAAVGATVRHQSIRKV